MSASVASANLKELELARLREGRSPVLLTLRPDGEASPPEPLSSAVRTPLGSVWKLFTYFYLIENKAHPPRYVCKGQDKEELFCCKPGDSIDVEEALSRSCGLYFSPRRLAIQDEAWKAFWSGRTSSSFEWLTHLSNLHPSREVPVIEMLTALDEIRKAPASFGRLKAALARVTIDGTARGSIKHLGSSLRVKTYTWDAPSETGKYIGGFAGWMPDDSAVWGRAPGTSAQVLKEWSKAIARLVQADGFARPSECVEVSFFNRYPLQALREMPGLKDARPGPLRGRFRALFRNGNRIEFSSDGELSLAVAASGELRITGRFDANQYVARVIDREISTVPLEAARAFSIAIRTYLRQNSRPSGGCRTIADSTRLQRVSPNPATPAALNIARWSDRLVIQNVPRLRYHGAKGGTGRLGWLQAVSLANAGSSFDQILRTVYPALRLAFAEERGTERCERLRNAERWITGRKAGWAAALNGISGFQEPAHVTVCRALTPQPYSDSSHDTIYMRYSGDMEDQLTAAHEFLHLAFKYHPSGLDEKFIEDKARDLVLNNEPAGNYE